MLFSEVIAEMPTGSYTGVLEKSEKIYDVTMTGSISLAFYPFNAAIVIDGEENPIAYSQLSHFEVKKYEDTTGIELCFEDEIIYSSIEEEKEDAGFFSSIFSAVKQGFREVMYDDDVEEIVEVCRKYFTDDELCPAMEVAMVCSYLNWDFPDEFNKALYTFVFNYRNQLEKFIDTLKFGEPNCIWGLLADNTYKATVGNVASTLVNGFFNYLTDDDDDDSRFGQILTEGGNKVLKKASEEGEECMVLLLNNGLYYLNPTKEDDTIVRLHADNFKFDEDENIKGAIDVYYTEDDTDYLILDNVSLDLLKEFININDNLVDHPVELLGNSNSELIEDNSQDDHEEEDDSEEENTTEESNDSDEDSELEKKLAKLKKLFEKGLISEEDYNAKKNALLEDL